MRRLAAVLLMSALGMLAATWPAAADVSGGGANNVVNVVNSSGTQLRGHAALAFFGGTSSQSSNVASALSENCVGCHSRAVAVQEVVVTGNPGDFRPSNAASAVNSGCTGCDTVAYANQHVLDVTGPVYLSSAARDQAMSLVARIQSVAEDPSVSDVPYCAPDCVPGGPGWNSPLTDALDALAGQLDQVVAHGLVSGGATITGTAGYRQAQLATQ